MAAAVDALSVPHPQSRAQLARWAVSDALVMTRRDVLIWLRVPAFVFFTLIQPVIFVLLFRYVFGAPFPSRCPAATSTT
jgi:hypothetical protein